MSQTSGTLSPIKMKNSLKNIKLNLSLNSPIIEELPKLKLPRLKRRKTEIIRHSFKFKVKTEEELEKEQRLKTKLFRHSAPSNMCIEALKCNPNNRSEKQIKIISYYLQMMKNFMSIFKGQIQNEELDEFLYNISSSLKYEHFPKNRFIFKFADKADKFYIILKGKVEFCVPKVNKLLMNEEEYILFLTKLRFNEENELIKKNLENNKISFNYGDNFDQFVLKSLNKHEKEKENIYSNEIYLCFKKIKELLIEKKNKFEDKLKLNKDEITIEEYLQRTSFSQISNPNPKQIEKKRILLNIYQYEKTNTYEEGDCFGLSSSKSKSHKRSTTAISTENCDLGVLDKKTYDQLLDKITKKAKEKLYKLVMSHKIFNPISKHAFYHKYCHMFRFTRFYFNNDIMDESSIFDKLIIFTSGEFILSVNKNIFELNDLIVKLKKLRANLCNFSEKMIKNDLKELEENEELINIKNYASQGINEYITKRQNLVISTVNDKMLLGYPDTVDQKNFIPLFNCKCLSIGATGYVIEKEMIKLFKRDGYLKESPPNIVIQKIEFYLKRLLEHKKSIMNRIEFLQEQDNKYGIRFLKEKNTIIKYENNSEKNSAQQNKEDIDSYINKNVDTLKDIDYSEKNEEKNDDILNITRNNLNPINIKNSNMFPFQSKKLVSLDPSYLPNVPKLIIKDRNIHISEHKKEKEHFITSIMKYKEEIQKKKYLLKLYQLKSHKYNIKEKLESKKYKMKSNKYDTKENYNDISNIFSKNENIKNSILNKYRKKTEDNVLDPKINSLKRQLNYEKLNSFLPKTNKTTEINTIVNTNNNTNTNLDIRNQYIFNSPKSETINNSSNINSHIKLRNKNLFKDLPTSLNLVNNSEIKNIKIKYNNLSLNIDKIDDDINMNKLNKTKFKHLYNELYNDYIHNNLKEDNKNKQIHSINKKYQKMDNYKLNKIQLKKIKKNIFSTEKEENNIGKNKREVSIIDPLYLEKFSDKYSKEKKNNI